MPAGLGTGAPVRRRNSAEGLLRDRDTNAVLRPRGLVRAEHDRPLLAVADRAQPAGGDARGDQVVLRGVGTTLAEGEVVLTRAALVAVTLDGEPLVRPLLQPSGLAVE